MNSPHQDAYNIPILKEFPVRFSSWYSSLACSRCQQISTALGYPSTVYPFQEQSGTALVVSGQSTPMVLPDQRLLHQYCQAGGIEGGTLPTTHQSADGVGTGHFISSDSSA
jgi:hypothetical protein